MILHDIGEKNIYDKNINNYKEADLIDIKNFFAKKFNFNIYPH